MSDNNKNPDFEKITFLELLRLLGNIKANVFWSLMFLCISSIISYTSVVAFLATQIQIDKTAIARGNPFEISIKNDELSKCIVNEEKTEINCKRFILLESFSHENIPSIQFLIRKIDDENSLQIYPVGLVKTDKVANENFKLFNFIKLDQPVLAQESVSEVQKYSFNWYGRENNFNFYEKYVDKYKIRRYYKDGWVLEYKVDKNHHSIPKTFQWIRKSSRNRCFLGICLAR